MTASGCPGNSAAHDGLDILPVKVPLRAEPRLLCAGCRAGYAAMGMAVTVIERRVEQVPVETDRRRAYRPAWLRHLTAREDGSWRVAS